MVSGKFAALSQDQDPELLAAARISLGALGIISQVTIQCVKDYNLLYKSYPQPFEDVLRNLDDLNKNDRLRLYWLSWIPDYIQVMTMNSTTALLAKESGTCRQTRETSLRRESCSRPPPNTYSLPSWQGLGLKVEFNKNNGTEARLD